MIYAHGQDHVSAHEYEQKNNHLYPAKGGRMVALCKFTKGGAG